MQGLNHTLTANSSQQQHACVRNHARAWWCILPVAANMADDGSFALKNDKAQRNIALQFRNFIGCNLQIEWSLLPVVFNTPPDWVAGWPL